MLAFDYYQAISLQNALLYLKLMCVTKVTKSVKYLKIGWIESTRFLWCNLFFKNLADQPLIKNKLNKYNLILFSV